jgi:cytochrome c peroxidase
MFATVSTNALLAPRVASTKSRGRVSVVSRCESASDRTVPGVINNVVPVSSVSLSVPRRGALFSAALAPLALFATPPASAAPKKRAAPGDTNQREAAARDEKAARAPEVSFAILRVDVENLMKRDGDFGPTMVRLAWHSSGTYDKMTKTGGSGGGTIRFKEELAHGGNAGLDKAVARLEPLKRKHPDVSWADLIAFVGVVAIEKMGGPTIGFSYGRVDEMDPSAVTPDGRLPDADKGDGPGKKTRKGLRDVFYRMGFGDREIVALSGAHALGRCHADASGYVGPWSGTPLLFNNSYFVLLKGLEWTPDDTKAKFQYRDPSGNLMMLPSDIALIEDPKFKKFVLEYAKDQKVFFEDFAAAFEKLETLGTSGLTPLKTA